jgi:hypothetical protein
MELHIEISPVYTLLKEKKGWKHVEQTVEWLTNSNFCQTRKVNESEIHNCNQKRLSDDLE